MIGYMEIATDSVVDVSFFIMKAVCVKLVGSNKNNPVFRVT